MTPTSIGSEGIRLAVDEGNGGLPYFAVFFRLQMRCRARQTSREFRFELLLVLCGLKFSAETGLDTTICFPS